MLIAYFLLVMVSFQEWPMLLGPYDYQECLGVKEFLIHREYELEGCANLPLPQPDAYYLQVPYLPEGRPR